MPVSDSRFRFEAIQVLRAVAALLVVIFHAIIAYDFRADLPLSWLGNIGHFRDFGAVGVDLFFVISGFIMAHALVSGPNLKPRQFFARRLIRVVPPYWLATLAMIPIIWWGDHDLSAEQFVFTTTMFPVSASPEYQLPVLLVGWSLAFELAFYGVVALAMALRPSGHQRIALAMQMTLLLGIAGISNTPALAVLAVFLNAIWLEFTLGLGCYWIWMRFGPKIGFGPAVILVAGGAAWLISTAALGAGHSADALDLIRPAAGPFWDERTGLSRAVVWGLPSAAILLGLMALCQQPLGEWLRQTAIWQILQRLGDASYSLYLVHLIPISIWHDHAPANQINADMMIAVLVVISCLLALAAYRWVEMPLINTMRRWVEAFERREPRWQGA